MCGRFVQSDLRAAEAYFGVCAPLTWRPTFNAAPSQSLAVVRLDGSGAKQLDLARWGFVPHWVHDVSKWPKPINARVESVFEKPTWREAIRQSRCLVPANGWYEWQANNGRKQPYYLSSGTPTALAGVWDHRREDDRDVITFAVLVRSAPEPVATIHDRAPVLLSPDQWDAWLDPALTAHEQIEAAMGRTTPPLRFWPVDIRVNRPSTNDLGLTEPVSLRVSVQ